MRRKLLERIAYKGLPETAAAAFPIFDVSRSFEFPFWHRRGTEFAILKLLAVPSIAALLSTPASISSTAKKTAKTAKKTKDAGDTVDLLASAASFADWLDGIDLLMAELLEQEPESDRAQLAMRRLSYLFEISGLSNRDAVYALCVLTIEPIRLISKYGTRGLHPYEPLVSYLMYSEIGIKIGIKDIPESFHSMMQFADEYEAAAKENASCDASDEAKTAAKYLVDAVVAKTHPVAQIFARQSLLAMIPAPLRSTLALPSPLLPLTRSFTVIVIMLVTYAITFCVLPRKEPVHRITETANSDGLYDVKFVAYRGGVGVKGGYLIETLGAASAQRSNGKNKALGTLHEKTAESIKVLGATATVS
eukprot:jgi/Hompol1/5435/HPOL_004445-RA